MHMVKMFRVDKERPTRLLPYYGYYSVPDLEGENPAIARYGQRKRWDSFGPGSRKSVLEDLENPYNKYTLHSKLFPNNQLDTFSAPHRGVSGHRTSAPEFSLYNLPELLSIVKNSSMPFEKKGSVLNDRIIQELPEDKLELYASSLDNYMKRLSDNKFGLRDIYNLPENTNTDKTGNLVVPDRYMPVFQQAFDTFLKDLENSKFNDEWHNSIVMPHNKSYYYTNGSSFTNDYINLLRQLAGFYHGEDDEDIYKTVPVLVDVGTNLFTRNDLLQHKLQPQRDYKEEIVAKSMTPEKEVPLRDIYEKYDNLYNKLYNTGMSIEDGNKEAQDFLGKTFKMDPVELSDEQYKNVIKDMQGDYFSDTLKLLRRP